MVAPQYSIERQSLAEQVYNYIKRLILSGDLKGGEKIPEEGIARQFGVSRTPIREALRRLDEYGLVYVKPRSYAIVVALDAQDAEQIALVRAQLEQLSVRLLAETGAGEDFDVLEILAHECQQFLRAGDVASTFEKDSQLHLEIARRTGNRHLYELFEKIDAKMQLLRLVLHLPIKELTRFVGQHTAIIQAMKSHQPDESVVLISQHILGQLDHFQEREA